MDGVRLSVVTTSCGFANSDASARASPWPVKNAHRSFSRSHGLLLPSLQVSISVATGLKTALLWELPADMWPLSAEGEGQGEKGAGFRVELYGRRMPSLTAHAAPWGGERSFITSLSPVIHELKCRVEEYLPKIRLLINAKADICLFPFQVR